eukprot:scaffold3759_cov425-Prasinococcus_capsulatus_cf.AAC.3
MGGQSSDFDGCVQIPIESPNGIVLFCSVPVCACLFMLSYSTILSHLMGICGALLALGSFYVRARRTGGKVVSATGHGFRWRHMTPAFQQTVEQGQPPTTVDHAGLMSPFRLRLSTLECTIITLYCEFRRMSCSVPGDTANDLITWNTECRIAWHWDASCSLLNRRSGAYPKRQE